MFQGTMPFIIHCDIETHPSILPNAGTGGRVGAVHDSVGGYRLFVLRPALGAAIFSRAFAANAKAPLRTARSRDTRRFARAASSLSGPEPTSSLFTWPLSTCGRRPTRLSPQGAAAAAPVCDSVCNRLLSACKDDYFALDGVSARHALP